MNLSETLGEARRAAIVRLARDAEQAAKLLEQQLATFGHAMAPESRHAIEGCIGSLRWSASDARLMRG